MTLTLRQYQVTLPHDIRRLVVAQMALHNTKKDGGNIAAAEREVLVIADRIANIQANIDAFTVGVGGVGETQQARS